MKNEPLGKEFIENLDKNYSELSKYFNFKIQVFHELSPLIHEINKCLILEFNKATITLTNNLLERLLKLALIYNETGIGPIPAEQWNEIFGEPNRKYISISLANSIEKCKKMELISDNEKYVLFNTVRELIRNGFSHADSSKILADFPDESKMYQGSFANPTELQEVSINQKVIPFMQAIHMDMFAKEIAKSYFSFVFKLVFRIETRLIEKFK